MQLELELEIRVRVGQLIYEFDRTSARSQRVQLMTLCHGILHNDHRIYGATQTHRQLPITWR